MADHQLCLRYPNGAELYFPVAQWLKTTLEKLPEYSAKDLHELLPGKRKCLIFVIQYARVPEGIRFYH